MLSTCLALLLAGQSLDQIAGVHATDEAKLPVEPVRAWSMELLDPAGLTRFHLTTRAAFSHGSSASVEGRIQFRFTPGIAASLTAPIGVRTSPGFPTSGFFGNLALGMIFGGHLSEGSGSLIRAAGGLDVYLPTAALDDDPDVALRSTAVAALRSYEPMLYIPKLFSFRGRGTIDFNAGGFSAGAEVGLVPAFDLRKGGGTAILLSMGARASFKIGSSVEPFLELGNTRQIAGDGAIEPPFMITPGVRLHIGEVFDPALFASFNFEESSAVIIGLDLAAAIRPERIAAREKKEVSDDFLDFE